MSPRCWVPWTCWRPRAGPCPCPSARPSRTLRGSSRTSPSGGRCVTCSASPKQRCFAALGIRATCLGKVSHGSSVGGIRRRWAPVHEEAGFCTPRSLRKRLSCLKFEADFPVWAIQHPAFALVGGSPARPRNFRAEKTKHEGDFRSERGGENAVFCSVTRNPLAGFGLRGNLLVSSTMRDCPAGFRAVRNRLAEVGHGREGFADFERSAEELAGFGCREERFAGSGAVRGRLAVFCRCDQPIGQNRPQQGRDLLAFAAVMSRLAGNGRCEGPACWLLPL